MKKIAILLVTLLFMQHFALAQIDKIRQESDKNKKENTENESTNPRSSHSDTYYDDAGEGCAEIACAACADIFLSIAFEIMAEHHQDIMSYRQENPSVLSLSLKPMFGYGVHFSSSPYDYYNLLPAVRGDWGVVATEFRMNYLIDMVDYRVDAFKTIDWLFILNLYPVANARLSTGFGFWYEKYQEFASAEFYLGYEQGLNDRSMLINIDSRVAFGNSNSDINYTEISGALSARFFKSQNLSAYGTIGASYQNFYLSYDVWLLNAGLNFNLH